MKADMQIDKQTLITKLHNPPDSEVIISISGYCSFSEHFCNFFSQC